MPIRNALNGALSGCDVEGSASPHGYPPDIGTHFAATGDDGVHEVTGLKPLDGAVLFSPGAGEPILVHSAHLP